MIRLDDVEWLSSIVISLGAELNAMMEHHTAYDTMQESKGARGTRVADAVGRKTVERAAARRQYIDISIKLRT
jgi:hypothetical protein